MRVPENAGAEELSSTNRRIEALQQENARAAHDEDAEVTRNTAVVAEFNQRSLLIERKKAQLDVLEATLKEAETDDATRVCAGAIEIVKEELL